MSCLPLTLATGDHLLRLAGDGRAPRELRARHSLPCIFASRATAGYTLRVNRVTTGGTIATIAEPPGPRQGVRSTCGAQPERQDATQTFQAGSVMSIASAHGLHDMFTGFVAPLLPVFIATLALSKTQAGMLMFFLQGPSLLQPLIGQLVDRFSLRPLVYFGPALTAVGMSLLGIAPSYTVLAVMLAIVGTNSAFFHSVGSVMTGRLSGRRLGRGSGLWMFGAELGRSIGPLLVVAAVQWWGPRGIWRLALIGLLGALLLYWRLRNVPFQPTRSITATLPWRQAIRGMGRIMLPLIGIVIARAVLVSALSTYLPTFLREEGADLVLAGASLSVFEAAGTIGALCGGALSDWLGRPRTIAGSLALCTPLMAWFLLSDGWSRMLSLIAVGFFLLSTLGVLMALVQESFPQNRALANGIYLAAYFVAGSVMSVVVGRMGDLWGLRTAFTISAVTPLLAAAMVLLLPRPASPAATV